MVFNSIREGEWIESFENEFNHSQEWLTIYHGEFDPGSERTLAARFKHASRTAVRVAIPVREWRTGE